MAEHDDDDYDDQASVMSIAVSLAHEYFQTRECMAEKKLWWRVLEIALADAVKSYECSPKHPQMDIFLQARRWLQSESCERLSYLWLVAELGIPDEQARSMVNKVCAPKEP